MNARRFTRSLVALGTIIDGAVTSAQASEAGRRPPRAALRKLGIDEHAFDDVRLG